MSLLMNVCRVIKPISPGAAFWLQYWRGSQRAAMRYEQRNKERKAAFLAEANRPGMKCLQIAVADGIGHKWGPNWISVDKYDHRDFIDHHDDVHALSFPDNTFDYLGCNAVLEHVEKPWIAIGEFHRVLKPGGRVWVSVPMTFPYHEAPKDFWRLTPDAMRVWMADFEEIACGVDYYARSSLAAITYFFGRKR